MLVSKKNLPFIHFIPGETTPRLDVAEPTHQGIVITYAARRSREMSQPFAEGCIESPVLLAGNQARLLDKVLVGTQRDVLHTDPVYTKLVLFARVFWQPKTRRPPCNT